MSTFSVDISSAAYYAYGLDDFARSPEVQRTVHRKGVTLTGSAEDLRYIALCFTDYADPNDLGDGVHPATRRACALAANRIFAVINRG